MASDPIFEHLPMLLNLGDFGTRGEPVIGVASAFRDPEGKTTITIVLNEETSSQLTNLAAIFDLKAIGFAGIKRRPQ